MILRSPSLSPLVQLQLMAFFSAQLWCVAALALTKAGAAAKTRVASLELREVLHCDWTIPQAGFAAVDWRGELGRHDTAFLHFEPLSP